MIDLEAYEFPNNKTRYAWLDMACWAGAFLLLCWLAGVAWGAWR